MNLKQKTFHLLFIIFLSGCVTTYGPRGLTGGYKERKVDDNAYIVSFFGNGHTSEQIIWNYWMFRCAELTLVKGYQYFTLNPAAEHAFRNAPNYSDPTSFNMLPLNANNIQPVYYTYQVTSYSSKATVEMYENPLPDDIGIVLDAKTIRESLLPYVKSGGKEKAIVRKDLLVRAAVEAAIRSKRVEQEDVDNLRDILQLKM